VDDLFTHMYKYKKPYTTVWFYEANKRDMQNFEPIFANDGYRPNVGIIICNREKQVFWARRINDDGWQFPQGGVSRDEALEACSFDCSY